MLYDRKYSDENIAKVMGGNFLRIMRETLPE
jgi:microsomal dipeptidase-like Zn-dependent dipeptidase